MSRDPLWMRIWVAESRWERRLVKERPLLASLLVIVPLVAYAIALRGDGPMGNAVRVATYVLGAVLLLVVFTLALQARRAPKHDVWLDNYLATQADETKQRNQTAITPKEEG